MASEQRSAPGSSNTRNIDGLLTVDDGKLARLRMLAEQEMRRTLPSDDGRRAAKRQRVDDGVQLGGRFDYAAIKELESGVTGFLLTCSLQRENSARKEALPILSRYLHTCRVIEPSNSEQQDGRAASVAAIKVACKGVVAYKVSMPADACEGSCANMMAMRLVQQAVGTLLADVEAGSRPRLQHAQRVMPVHTTCRLDAAALRVAGALLAAQVVAELQCSRAHARADSGQQQSKGPEQPGSNSPDSRRKLTFGIGVKQRTLDGAAAQPAPHSQPPHEVQQVAAGAKQDGPTSAAQQATGGGGTPAVDHGGSRAARSLPALDRGAIIASLAAGFEGALRQHGFAVGVDLKDPDWILLVEGLPAGGAEYAALCALPRRLCALKPKLHIRTVGKA